MRLYFYSFFPSSSLLVFLCLHIILVTINVTLVNSQINPGFNVTEHAILSPQGYAPPLLQYFQRSYANITDEIKRLAASPQCSDILYVTSAQELFKNRPGVHLDADFFECGDRRCETLIVRLASKSTLTSNTPEIFLSGALHGDERLGPNTLFELISLACHMYRKHPIITYLIETRSIWMTPTTNAWGYAHNKREENGIDPNRDFPYRRAPQECMATITGRALNELFLDHLFQLGVTFHGGTRVMSYEWGSFDHVKKQQLTESRFNALSPVNSLEPPDLSSQKDLAVALQRASGWLEPSHKFARRERYGYRRLIEDRAVMSSSTTAILTGYNEASDDALSLRSLQFDSEGWNSIKSGPGDGWFYPVGSMSDLVYPVDGGFEDWSYSSSWQKSPDPISVCEPKTYGGYPSSRTNYSSSDSLRTSTFLVEMDYLKSPPDWQFGSSIEILNPSGLDGHIARNIRLLLKMIELVDPDILLLQPPKVITSSPSSDFSIQSQSTSSLSSSVLSMTLLPVGCQQIDSLDILLLRGSCNSMSSLRSNMTHPLFKLPSTLGRSITSINSPMNCSSIGIWEDWDIDPLTLKIKQKSFNRNGVIPIRIPLYDEELSGKGLCIMARGVFDQHWGTQITPDPPVAPQTHVARTRLLDAYKTSAGNQTIESTRIKIFPNTRSWGGSKWRYGIDVKPSTKRLRESSFVATPSNQIQVSTGPLYFRIDHQQSSVQSLPYWTATFMSSTRSQQKTIDRVDSDNIVDWNPFTPSDSVADVISAMSMKRILIEDEQIDGNVDRLDLLLSTESLTGLNGSAEFVLRVWDSKELWHLGKPLNVDGLRNKGSMKSAGDGELARWRIDATGRLLMGSTRIGLSPNVEAIVNDTALRISFIPRVRNPNLISLKSLLGMVFTLEMVPLDQHQAIDPIESRGSNIGPTSVFAVVLDEQRSKEPQLHQGADVDHNYLCIFKSDDFQPIASFKSGQMQSMWFKDPRRVEQGIEAETNGFVVLSSSDSTEFTRGKVCRMQSTGNATRNDTIKITSTSQCEFPPIQVSRPMHHFLNPLQERFFPIASNSQSTCREGDILNVSLLSNDREYGNATCTLKRSLINTRLYMRSFCNPKTLRPLNNHHSISLVQQVAIGSLAITFLMCASIPIINTFRMKRGYSQVNDSHS